MGFSLLAGLLACCSRRCVICVCVCTGFISVTDAETAVSSRVGVRVSAYDASVAGER